MIEKYVDAEEMRRLLSTLVVILAALSIGLLFAILVVPGLRNANRPGAPMPVTPVVGEPGWLDPTEFPPERGREIPAVDPKTLIEPSPRLLGLGKTLYPANCSACHGESGHGDGPAAGTMSPAPRNFTSPTAWVNGYDLPAIYRTLTGGIAGSSMASFNYLSKKDRMALAHYVQSLGAYPHPPGGKEAVAALSQELAAPGGRTPNRIPVSMAMAKLEAEFTAPQPLAVAPEDQSAGAEILRSLILDPRRAALTLAGSAAWRSDAKVLAAAILADAPGNGFSVRAANLGPADWQLLQKEILRLSPPDKTAR
jgi:mono/diheme cytochrome c family protein